jgi:two-component system KDP operon response regulator KdpE
VSKILLLDDDQALLRILSVGLKAHGYNVTVARRGLEAVSLAKEVHPDIAVIDLGLPDLDGLQVLVEIKLATAAKVMVLSAFHDEAIKIKSLDLGADDYVTKPFGMGELAARLRVLERQRQEAQRETPQRLSLGPFHLNPIERTATFPDGTEVRLTKREFNLLKLFLENQGKLLSYQVILNAVWGPGYDSEMQYVRVYVNRLRAKYGPLGTLIRNVAGEGYLLDFKAAELRS